MASIRQLFESRLGMLAVWFVAWGLLGVIDGVQLIAGLDMEGRQVAWPLALARGLQGNVLWGVIGLGVLWWSARYPFERGRIRPVLGWHVVGCLLAVALYNVAYAALLHGRVSLKDGSTFVFGDLLRKLFIFYGFMHLMMYSLIVLGHHVWLYYRRLRDRDQREAELQSQLAQARLDTLRMQVNPHFLFNSLNTIAALIHDQPEAADRMTTRLAELLRFTLDHTDAHEIPLENELALVRRYLDIEQARFGDRLEVEVHPADGTGQALVPSLILQPLVENAVRHGVEAREAGGRIGIAAARDGEVLELRVTDNGPGLPASAGGPARERVGLSNTRSRLAQLYGTRQQLELRPADGGGLEVRIRIPFRPAAAAAASPA